MRVCNLIASFICLLIAPFVAISMSFEEPSNILREVEKHGASSVIRRLSEDESAWNLIIMKIASGKPDWIDVALSLKFGTDAGTSGELHDAMFEALGKNPYYVLNHAVPKYAIADLCGGRHDPMLSFERAISEHEAIIASVKNIEEEKLMARKAECLLHLEEGKLHLLRFFGRK